MIQLQMDLRNFKLTDKRKAFKPFKYHWAWEKQDKQIKMHWIPTEIQMDHDLKEFLKDLTDQERTIVDKVCRFFTQVEMEVGRAYIDYFLPVFQAYEVRIMLLSFANMEGIHSLAYSYLITSLRLKDEEYSEFVKLKEMKEQSDLLATLNKNRPHDVAIALATIAGFIEGFELYGSFAILLYFSRARHNEKGKRNCLRGMGQIVEFTQRDESLHVEAMVQLFHEYLKENKNEIDMVKLEEEVIKNGKILLDQEIRFIDLVFGGKDLDGLKREDVKTHIKYLFDVRLVQLGFQPMYDIKATPLSYVEVVGHEKSNFFETTSSEYSMGNIKENINWNSFEENN
jgi:ribonucleoside-diphosphate reductase beta chain